MEVVSSSPAASAPAARTDAFRVLFVCVGNVCRSPVAERLLAARLPADRFEVSSAGTGAMVGYGMSQYAAEELRGLGGDPTGFGARQLEPEMVERSDLVLTATRKLRSRVLADAPEALRRTFTILEFAVLVQQAEGSSAAERVSWAGIHRSLVGNAEQDVPDPFRRGVEEHALAAATIDVAVQQIAKGLEP